MGEHKIKMSDEQAAEKDAKIPEDLKCQKKKFF